MNRPLLKMRTLTRLAVLACLMPSGCGGVRVVTVPSTQPRQLAENVQAYVYIETANGQRIKSTTRSQLYEGEWVLSDPGE